MSTPGPTQPAYVPEGAAPKSFLRRHWILLAVAGALLTTVLAAGAFTWFIFQIFAGLKAHPAAQQAVATAQADPRIIAMLGQPITTGSFAGGNITVNNGVQGVDLRLFLEGPSGEGKLIVVATRGANGAWNYTRLEVVKDGSGTVNLLTPEHAAPTRPSVAPTQPPKAPN